MKHILLASFGVLVFGCSHVRVETATVQFPFARDLVEKVQLTSAGRGPAGEALTAEAEVSTRRVYFSSLYHQYLTLGEHLHKKPDLDFCPQFHHDKLETEALVVPKVSFLKRSHIEAEGRDYFPELAFNKKFSLRDYHRTMKTEIDQLCEEGMSDNFYKFDNLVTHYAHKQSFHLGKTAMAALLKIPIFANFYLVKMLQGGAAGAVTPAEKKFITMTQTGWFERYVSEASSRRNGFIKNKMVRR